MVDTPEAPAAPRWQRRPDERPDEILDAAVEVFGEHGFARARLDDIARRAGVSKGTLYLYFASKDEIFRAMVQRRITPAVTQAEARLEGWTGSWRDLIELTIRGFWHVMSSERMSCIAKLVQSELTQFPELGRFYFEAAILRTRRLLREILRRGVEAGEFRPEALAMAPRALPAMLVHLAHSRSYFQQFDAEAPTDDALIDGAIDLLLHGIAMPAGAR